MAAPATILKESLKGTGRPGMGRESGDIEPLTTLRTRSMSEIVILRQ